MSMITALQFREPVALLIPLLMLGRTTLAQTITKLNDPLPLGLVDGDVSAYQISPDGCRVVYLADQDTDQVVQLYVAPVDGSAAPVRLNPAERGFEVTDFQISPDGTEVVFAGGVGASGILVVPIDGSAAAVALTVPVTGNPGVGNLQISPDGDLVVYSAAGLHAVPIDGSAAPLELTPESAPFSFSPDGGRVLFLLSEYSTGPFDLFSVPVDLAAAPVELDGDLVIESDYAFHADGAHVFFRAASDELSGDLELYSAPIDGSRPAKRESVDLVEGRDVFAYRLAPTGERAVYLADQRTDGVLELFSVPLTGRYARLAASPGGVKSTRISGTMAIGGDVRQFEITPDGSRVVYVADQDADGVFELFVTAIEGGVSPLQLNPALIAGGDVFGFQISPDGSRIVYHADQDTDGVAELYGVPVDGSQPAVRLSGPQPAAGDVQTGFRISPDSSLVVYLADEDTDQANDLYSAPIEGGEGGEARVRLSAGTSAQRDVASFQLAASEGVVFRANQGPDLVFEVQVTPLDGSLAPLTLNGPLVDDPVGRVHTFALSPLGDRSAYSADQDTFDVTEIYGATTTPVHQVVKLNDPFVSTGDVQRIEASPDGACAVFLADAEADGVVELYSVPLDGGTAQVKLNDPLVAGGDVQDFRIGSDGARVVYRADQTLDGVEALYSVPIDGSAAPVQLTGSVEPSSFELSPDASWAVFQGGVNIYSVPVDGSAAPLPVNPALTTPRSAANFLISADSARVVYSADPGALSVYHVYSAPIEGGQPHVRLNATLASGEHLYGFRVSPDGASIAYRTYKDSGPQALFGAPIDGSAPATGLYGPVPFAITEFAITSGNRVVFSTWEPGDELELHGVPLDGSAGAVLLSGGAVAGLDVLEFELAPGSDQVVFHVEDELYVAPADGSQAPLLLSQQLPFQRSLTNFDVSADGTTVVFRSDADALLVFELFSVPIDASLAPVKRNGPLVHLGDVGYFLMTAGAQRIVYMADQEADEILELYQSDL